MIARRLLVALLLLLMAANPSLAAPPDRAGHAPAQPTAPSTYRDLYLPLLWRGATLADLAPLRLATPPTATATATAGPSATPTNVPTPTLTPTPTDLPEPSRIFGKMTADGKPLAAGYGSPGTPRIELMKQVAGLWQPVAVAETTAGGAFVFENPPPLGAGEIYQVWWTNDSVLGFDGFVNRWRSRQITPFGAGDEADVGVFELADLKYTAICADCLQTLPITFKWNARPHGSETYHWALYKECGLNEERVNAYHTAALGHVSQYTLNSPPPGFSYDKRYCWFIYIDDGVNGTGWPFYDWRVTFCSGPATCR